MIPKTKGAFESVTEFRQEKMHSTSNAPLRREEVIDLMYEMLSIYNGNVQFQNPVVLQNLTADPTVKITGALAVVGGKLKIWDGSAWTIVGTQT